QREYQARSALQRATESGQQIHPLERRNGARDFAWQYREQSQRITFSLRFRGLRYPEGNRAGGRGNERRLLQSRSGPADEHSIAEAPGAIKNRGRVERPTPGPGFSG